MKRSKNTYALQVEVEAQYLADQSDPANQQYLFAYQVRITNTGERPVQVVSRHWVIIDGDNRREEVKGLGVVGQQPVISPGETFEYTSGCLLETPVGTMRGTYLALGDDGDPFRVEIPEFLLAVPRTLH